MIGEKIRQLRRKLGMTIEQLLTIGRLALLDGLQVLGDDLGQTLVS